MRKELTIAAKFDTGDFDKSVESMQKKLKELYAPADLVRMQTQTAGKMQQAGMGGIMGQSPEALQKSGAAAKRELDNYIREQAQGQEKLTRLIIQRQGVLDNLKRKQDEMVKGSQQELDIKKQIGQVEENNARIAEQYRARDKVLNEAITMRQSGQAPMAPGKLDMSNVLRGVAGVLSSLATGAAVVQHYAELPIKRSTALGGATQSVFGQQLQDISKGDVVNQMAFMPERQQAHKMAMDAMKSKEMTDPLVAAGTLGVGVILNAVFGDKRLWSLMAGSITGAVATNLPKSAFGGAPGAKALAEGASKYSEQYMSTYQSLLLEEYGKNYQQLADAEVKKNPLKNLAAQRLQGNYMQDLETQRMLGLGYEGFHGKGGFEERANIAGFNPDMARQMAVQMRGAGGSTRGMQGGSTLGLQAQRGFDMTNAGAVLGRISGGAGGSAASEQVFRKLLTESMKDGLDRSEFREEQRKFADITSEILSRSGVKNAEDAGRVLEGFSRMMGKEPTMRDISGAQGAYAEQQGFSAETGGRGGALQFAGLMKQPGMAAVGARGLAGLMEMPEADLTTSNPFVIAEAVKSGKSPQELIANVMKAKREKSLIEVGLNPEKMKTLDEYMKKGGMDEATLTEEQIKGMPANVRAAYFESQEAATIRSQYESPQKRTAVARGLRTAMAPGAGEEFGPGTAAEEAARKLQQGPGTRVEDDVVKATGVAAQAMLENFRNFKKEITPASDALDTFTKKLILMAGVMAAASDKDKAAIAKYAAEQLGPKTQPQGGKPAPGTK